MRFCFLLIACWSFHCDFLHKIITFADFLPIDLAVAFVCLLFIPPPNHLPENPT